MLVTLNELLIPAQKDEYAVIAPDFLNLSMLKHYLAVAEIYNTPIIASYPSLPPNGFPFGSRLIKRARELCKATTVPICLHLDHGKNVSICLKAVRMGFTSIMFDGSQYDFKTNINMTKQVVDAAARAGISVEAELGHVGENRHYADATVPEDELTCPQQAEEFVDKTGVDALAVSIGTLHGTYRGTPKLDFHRLNEIRSKVDIPLVLHGGSGTGKKNLLKAVKTGICKINVFTDIIRPYLKATVDGINPIRKGTPGNLRREVVRRIFNDYFDLSCPFTSVYHAPESRKFKT